MICRRCGHPQSKILETRGVDYGVRRRHECAACGHRWPTIEISTTRTLLLKRWRVTLHPREPQTS